MTFWKYIWIRFSGGKLTIHVEKFNEMQLKENKLLSIYLVNSPMIHLHGI